MTQGMGNGDGKVFGVAGLDGDHPPTPEAPGLLVQMQGRAAEPNAISYSTPSGRAGGATGSERRRRW